jgi:aminoglycoside phosphotransferase (APT) family kinase protein
MKTSFKFNSKSRLEKKLDEKLLKYILTEFSANTTLLPKGAITARITELTTLDTRKIGNASYSFLLSYESQKFIEKKNLVLKIYRDTLDPVLHQQRYEKSQRCLTEFQVLDALKSVDFPVPQSLLCETNSNVLGYPFMIMQREDTSTQTTFDIDFFARNLAELHGLDIKKFELPALRVPANSHGFARDCIIYLKKYLMLYPTHDKDLRKDFDFAINWLDSNFSKHSCFKYCLLHGDYRAKFNTILTKEGKMLVIDWEDALIGDPIYDVSIAFVRAQVDFGKEIANQFVGKYMEHNSENMTEKIQFYKLIAYLRLAVTHSAVISAPLRAYKIRGGKALLLFPFLDLPFISQKVGTSADVVWIDNFTEFVKEYLR